MVAAKPLVVQRVLSPTQAATRTRIIAAAVELATAGGYDGFGMREVAATAGLSTATVYQYYGSKDHVLVDALVEGGVRSTEAVGRRRQRSVESRLETAFTKVVRAYEEAPLLYHAMFRAYLGPAGLRTDGESPWSGRSWISEAVGDAVSERTVVVEMLENQVLASMISLMTGTPGVEVIARFRRATRRLLAG